MGDNMNKIRTTPSSGNVFEDIGLPDAGELSIKAMLVLNLQRLMKLHKMTQKEVAKRVGGDQPTLSKLLRGQLDLVSVERLLQWHATLGQDVSITVRDHFSRTTGEKPESGRIEFKACA